MVSGIFLKVKYRRFSRKYKRQCISACLACLVGETGRQAGICPFG